MEITVEKTTSQKLRKIYVIAWIFGLVFYFLEYAVRSAPAVMIPELSDIFGVSTIGVSAILGTYYYTYSVTSLVSGITLDKIGAKYTIPAGLFILGLGCFLFSIPNTFAGNAGRLLQGAGSAFAFTGCVYLATHGFSSRSLATAIGFTQCLGMLGGSAGQFAVGPLVHSVLSVYGFWIYAAIASLVVGVALFLVTPSEPKSPGNNQEPKTPLLQPYKIVFTNPQSYLCGIVSGLLFAPTTIFIMTWGVAFFEQDLGFSYQQATLVSSMVPLGWVIGCPLLGWFADKIGRRKPALLAGALLMLLSLAQLIFLPGLLPAAASRLLFGIGSGAAMIPYSVIKEANPDQVKGSATGAINFLTFGVTALLGPVFTRYYGQSLATITNHEAHFQASGIFWMFIIVAAMGLSLLLQETGPAVKNPAVR